MASLEGLVEEWDGCPHVRTRMHTEKTLFVMATLACAWLNYALTPLVKRLEESAGAHGMHKVPDLIKQKLEQNK